MTITIGVVGAGIGGLAFGALAAQAGHKVTVFDQFESPKPLGSGLVIQPVGQAVLDAITLPSRESEAIRSHKTAGEAALALGQIISRLLGHEARVGRQVLDVFYDVAGTGRFGLAIHRASLFHVLLSAAQANGTEVCSGQKVTGRDKGYVLVGEKREGPFDLIVDAAGAKSPLSPLRGQDLAFGAIWGTVPWPETELPLDQLSQCYRRADHMVGVLPIGRLPENDTPLASIFWSMRAQSYTKWLAQPLADWKNYAIGLWPEFRVFLSEVENHADMTMATYSHGTLARPIGPGIAHIGDAAHRASPQLGQGANMALLDAYALSCALNEVDNVTDALSLYAQRRRKHVFVYQTISAAFTPQYQSDSRTLSILRDYVLNPISRIPPFPAMLSRLVCGDFVLPYGGAEW